MVITDRGLLLENEELKSAAIVGNVELPYDRIDKVLHIANKVIYDAQSERAVQVLVKYIERNCIQRHRIIPAFQFRNVSWYESAETVKCNSQLNYREMVEYRSEKACSILENAVNHYVMMSKHNIIDGGCTIGTSGNIDLRINYKHGNRMDVYMDLSSIADKWNKIGQVIDNVAKIDASVVTISLTRLSKHGSHIIVIDKMQEITPQSGEEIAEIVRSTLGCEVAWRLEETK